jgi:glycosyltransferase involved in cell wall biosynthesis
MPKVSVIIPAYNAERTLSSTVASVQAQTLADIEVLVVDDGSTDSTGVIADRISAADRRVRAIHQANGGCYRARLAGMRQSSAPFFGFVDADDSVEPRMYERLLGEAVRTDADVVQCRSPGSMKPRVPLLGTREDVLAEFVRPVLLEGRGAAFVWDKLYRRKDDFAAWLDGNFGSFEDLVHNMQLFVFVERFAYLDEELYRYRPNDGSVTRNFNVDMLARWSETIAARRALAGRYGVGADDRTLDRWVVRNVLSGLLVAACGNAASWDARVGNVGAILGYGELGAALGRLGRFDSSAALAMSAFRAMPRSVVTALLRGMHRIKSSRLRA